MADMEAVRICISVRAAIDPFHIPVVKFEIEASGDVLI